MTETYLIFGLVWFGLVWFYGISTIVGYLMLNPFLYIQTVLFQTIQFCTSTKFNSIWSTYRTLSGAITLGQRGPGRNGNEGVLCIPQSSSITRVSFSDCFMSYPGYSLGGVLFLCIDSVGIFYSPTWLGLVVYREKQHQCWCIKI